MTLCTAMIDRHRRVHLLTLLNTTSTAADATYTHPVGFLLACEMRSDPKSPRRLASLLQSRTIGGMMVAALMLTAHTLAPGQAAEPATFGKIYHCEPGP